MIDQTGKRQLNEQENRSAGQVVYCRWCGKRIDTATDATIVKSREARQGGQDGTWVTEPQLFHKQCAEEAKATTRKYAGYVGLATVAIIVVGIGIQVLTGSKIGGGIAGLGGFLGVMIALTISSKYS
jgi:hypothetical protein